MSTPRLDLPALPVPRRGVARLMGEVMLALVPGTLVYAWRLDPGVLMNIAVAIVAALVLEALALALRRRAILTTLGDGSIVLAAWLLALALPPGLPLAHLLVGVLAMVMLGKHLYGGLGHNPFNPAMVGYAVLLVSFPITMTAWPDAASSAPPSPASHLGAEAALSSADWDALTAATPLDGLRTLQRQHTIEQAAGDEWLGVSSPSARERGALILASPWPSINAAFLLGGLWLLARGIIGWRIPVSLLGTLALLHAAHGILAATPQPPPHAELLAGAAVLGAFFIATDPVSAPSGARARLLYGGGIGALAFTLREFSAYPEGIAFAVLLMNATVPLLDRLSAPGRTARGER